MEMLANIPFEVDAKVLMEKVLVEPGSEDATAFMALLDNARAVARPTAVYQECFIDAKEGDAVTIAGIPFRSRTLRRNLEKPERIFAYVATCGREIDTVPLPAQDMVMEYWRDTLKSVLLRAAIQHLTDHLARRYRLGKTASMSPGSGDADTWPIEQQRGLFTLLGGRDEVRRQSGVELTDSFLMIPNKTVSGIRFSTETDFRSCQVCHRAKCPSRGAPYDEALWNRMQHGENA